MGEVAAQRADGEGIGVTLPLILKIPVDFLTEYGITTTESILEVLP